MEMLPVIMLCLVFSVVFNHFVIATDRKDVTTDDSKRFTVWMPGLMNYIRE